VPLQLVAIDGLPLGDSAADRLARAVGTAPRNHCNRAKGFPDLSTRLRAPEVIATDRHCGWIWDFSGAGKGPRGLFVSRLVDAVDKDASGVFARQHTLKHRNAPMRPALPTA
jgi:hypothetical protein